jgi:hypothetical protein
VECAENACANGIDCRALSCDTGDDADDED